MINNLFTLIYILRFTAKVNRSFNKFIQHAVKRIGALAFKGKVLMHIFVFSFAYFSA